MMHEGTSVTTVERWGKKQNLLLYNIGKRPVCFLSHSQKRDLISERLD
jgi:hypothetical protein